MDENVTPKLFQGKFDLLKPFIGSAMVAYSAKVYIGPCIDCRLKLYLGKQADCAYNSI